MNIWGNGAQCRGMQSFKRDFLKVEVQKYIKFYIRHFSFASPIVLTFPTNSISFDIQIVLVKYSNVWLNIAKSMKKSIGA